MRDTLLFACIPLVWGWNRGADRQGLEGQRRSGEQQSSSSGRRKGLPSCSLSSRQMVKAGCVVSRMQSSGFCLVPGARTECFLLFGNCSYLGCFSRLENKKVPKKRIKKCYTSILCSANTFYKNTQGQYKTHSNRNMQIIMTLFSLELCHGMILKVQWN